jgi:hypothetical protein
VEAASGDIAIANSYTQTAGATRLSGGSISSSVLLDIQGGSLEGFGILTGDVQSAGTISPGLSTGALTIAGNLSLQSGSVLDFELGGLNQGNSTDGYDFLDVNGNFSLAGSLSLSLMGGFQSLLQTSDVFTIAEADSAIIGFFDNVANGDFLATADNLFEFRVHYGAGSPFGDRFIVLDSAAALVPEPSTLALCVTGLIAACAVLWRRKRERRFV